MISLVAPRSDWRREALRTNLWLVPTIEVLAAVALYFATHALDRAAYGGSLTLPAWMEFGTADAARQILTTLAAAVITVVGIVFSITIVTLTLASTQFGPRMLRNFIRDRGTQFTLGTFVATFVYATLVLISIGPAAPGRDFVPHLSITVAVGLVTVSMAVLIYFIHHTAMSIQLPQVIASIARDLSRAIDAESSGDSRAVEAGPSVSELLRRIDDAGGFVPAPASGYLQFAQDLAFSVDQLVEIAIRALSPAVNDTFTALTCIDWLGDSLCKITARWQPLRVHRDSHGYVRVITAHVSYERLVERSFDKIRQAGRGMPAVLIRQLEALTKIVDQTADAGRRELLLAQAAMVLRAGDESVSEPADRGDVQQAHERVLAAAGSERRVADCPRSGEPRGPLSHPAGSSSSSSTDGTALHQLGAELVSDSAASAAARSVPRPSLSRPTSETSQSSGATR